MPIIDMTIKTNRYVLISPEYPILFWNLIQISILVREKNEATWLSEAAEGGGFCLFLTSWPWDLRPSGNTETFPLT